MAAPPASRLDANQVLQASYDEETGRLRTDSLSTIVNADIDVALDSSEDSVEIANAAGIPLAINTDGSINVVESNIEYVTLMAESGTNTYIGLSIVGNSTNSTKWKIKRISEIGSNITISWADGSTGFNKTWDDRATYDYSI